MKLHRHLTGVGLAKGKHVRCTTTQGSFHKEAAVSGAKWHPIEIMPMLCAKRMSCCFSLVGASDQHLSERIAEVQHSRLTSIYAKTRAKAGSQARHVSQPAESCRSSSPTQEDNQTPIQTTILCHRPSLIQASIILRHICALQSDN